jgi:hypothetical protein
MSTTQQAEPAAEPIPDYETIRAIVAAWPPALRAALLHDLIDSLVQVAKESKFRKKTLGLALGLANNGGPAPSDEEVQRWLDEHREAKYG